MLLVMLFMHFVEVDASALYRNAIVEAFMVEHVFAISDNDDDLQKAYQHLIDRSEL